MDMHSAQQKGSRLVVMMTPTEKRAIEARARTMSLTTSEFIRRAAHDYDEVDPTERVALELLADELEKTVVSMRNSFQRAREDFEFHQAEMARIKASA